MQAHAIHLEIEVRNARAEIGRLRAEKESTEMICKRCENEHLRGTWRKYNKKCNNNKSGF